MSDATNGHVVLKTGPGFKAILTSLIKIVDKLAAVAADDLQRAPVGASPPAPAEKAPRAVFGFCLRTVPGCEGLVVERFGNVRSTPDGGDPIVTSVREPLTEMRDRGTHLELRLEMPGIREEDLQIDVNDQRLRLTAKRGESDFAKEIRWPASAGQGRPTVSCQAGLVEIRCPK